MRTKFCNRPGCPEIVAVGNGLCAKHQSVRYREQDHVRGNSTERGYDADWRRFRRRFLSGHPLCADCEAEGAAAAAQEVHHIQKLRIAPQLRLVESNCLALCKTHHSKRTAKGE